MLFSGNVTTTSSPGFNLLPLHAWKLHPIPPNHWIFMVVQQMYFPPYSALVKKVEMVKGTAYLDLKHSVFLVIQQPDFSPNFAPVKKVKMVKEAAYFNLKKLMILVIILFFSSPITS
jgi:hypothetical protein